MIRRPPRSTLSSSSAASDVYKRQRPHRAGPGAWRRRPDLGVGRSGVGLLPGATAAPRRCPVVGAAGARGRPSAGGIGLAAAPRGATADAGALGRAGPAALTGVRPVSYTHLTLPTKRI